MRITASDNIYQVKAPAKVNLFLLVGPPRGDGYHPVCSLMEPVSLYDTLRARRVPGAGMTLRIIAGEAGGSGAAAIGGLPPEKNTVLRAARALERAAGISFDAELELVKQIPVAAGLGGGSSDAAAALRLLTAMYELDIPEEEMSRLALSVGADVPFFLEEGVRLAEGVGERLTALPPLPGHAIVLVAPGFALAASAAYQRFDELSAVTAAGFHSRCAAVRRSLSSLDDFDALAAMLENDLELPATAICRDIKEAKQQLAAAGCAAVLMSGSGPTVFGLFPDEAAARTAAASLQLDSSRILVVKPHVTAN